MTSTQTNLQFGRADLATGVTLHYAETGDARGEPVILLHGLSDSWVSYSRVLPLLSPTWHAFALDGRGHGDSDRPKTYSMDDLTADVVAFMNAKGLSAATVVGHSLGSYVAQRVAIEAPERVTQLVLVGTMVAPRNEVTTELGAMFASLQEPVPPEFVREFQASTVHHPVPESFLETVVSESLKLSAFVWRAVGAGFLAADHAARLGSIAAPTLILWGEADTVFPLEDQERLTDLIPRATLKVYPDTGHALHWERPERFVKDLEDFLKGTKL